MNKQIANVINRLKIVFLVCCFPCFTGCGDSSSYEVSDNRFIGRSIVNEIHGYLEQFVLALATAAIAYNAALIIFEPTSSVASEDSVYMAKKRIFIIISAVIAFYIIKSVFSKDFLTQLG